MNYQTIHTAPNDKLKFDFLLTKNFLSEFKSEVDKSRVRTNLGIPDEYNLSWGNLSGTITQLTDLVNYINSVIKNYKLTDNSLFNNLSLKVNNIDVSTYVNQDNLTTTLSNYVTTSTLSNYVKTSDLNTTLADYIKLSDLNSKLNTYITTDTLSKYSTTSAIKTTLNDYAKTTDLTSQINALSDTYAKISDVENTYAKTTDVSTTISAVRQLLVTNTLVGLYCIDKTFSLSEENTYLINLDEEIDNLIVKGIYSKSNDITTILTYNTNYSCKYSSGNKNLLDFSNSGKIIINGGIEGEEIIEILPLDKDGSIDGSIEAIDVIIKVSSTK